MLKIRNQKVFIICLRSIVILLIFSSNPLQSQENKLENSDFPVLRGEYLGQKPPGSYPQVFAPFILSKSQPEWAFSTSFSPDGNEFYFSQFDTVRKIDNIMLMRRINNIWTKPEIVALSSDYSDFDQYISPDGMNIFWRSRRPLPGNTIPEKYTMIWFATRTARGWSTPKPIQYGKRFIEGGYPSISQSDRLYFSAYGENNIGKGDIFVTNFNEGDCTKPSNLGPIVNTKYSEGDLFVAPDESYLIVSCWNRPDNHGESDLYISFRDKRGKWTQLINIGSPINTINNENCPYISPDGKYFFYTSVDGNSTPATTKTYWIDTGFIHQLKSEHYLK